MSPAPQKIRASTQEHLDIAHVQDGLVVLKDNSCSLLIQTTAVNFGLLSEKEQEATIFAYASLLNSLSFSIQILIHSRQKDISAYLTLIDQQIQSQTNEIFKGRLEQYRQFIENTVKKNKVLDKKFYVIIPFTSAQFKKETVTKLLERAKTDLYPKRDHLVGQFQRLGLRTKQLNSQEIIQLFHNLYNPGDEGQGFIEAKDYQATLVQTLIQPPAPIPAPQPTISTPPPPLPATPSAPLSAAPTTEITLEKPSNYTPQARTNLLVPPAPDAQIKEDEGKKLQNKIENIVQKVTGSADQSLYQGKQNAG